MNTLTQSRQETGGIIIAPDQELLAAVLAYEHEPLVARLQKKLNINEHKARQIFEDTKRFLDEHYGNKKEVLYGKMVRVRISA